MPDIIVISGGPPRDRWLANVADAIGGTIKHVFAEQRRLPSKLPRAEYLVLVVDSTSHLLLEQAEATRHKGSQVIKLSRKWSITQQQLGRLGFKSNGKEETIDPTFIEWPTLNRFTTELLKRLPKITKNDLIALRHSEVVTPVRLSTSLDSVHQSHRIGVRSLEIDERTSGSTPVEKMEQVSRDLLAGLEAPEADPNVEDRIWVIERFAELVSRTNTMPAAMDRGPRLLVKEKDMPVGWRPIPDLKEAAGLCLRNTPLDAPRMEGHLSLTLFRAALQEWRDRRDQPAPKPVPEVKAAVQKPEPVPVKECTITAKNYSRFLQEMFRRMENLSLADIAWLRQQTELWPVRMGNRAGYYAQWCRLNSRISKRTDRSRERRYGDEELLMAAYELLSGSEGPKEPEVIIVRQKAIGAVAEWLEERDHRISKKETGLFIQEAASAGVKLTQYDLLEAEDLAAFAKKDKIVQKPGTWVDDLIKACLGDQPEEVKPKDEPEKAEPKKKEEPEVTKPMPALVPAVQEGPEGVRKLVMLHIARIKELMADVGLQSIHIDAAAPTKVTVMKIVEETWE